MTPTAGSNSPRLRIAQVCPYSLSRPGGVQSQVLGLARALEGRHHRVTVFAPIDDLDDAPKDIELVATGHSVPLPGNGSVAPVLLSVPVIVRATRTIRDGGFDVIHVHEPFAPGVPYGLVLARGLPPLVSTFHRSGGSPFYTVLAPLARPLIGRFAVRCAVSESARATAAHALGGQYEVGFNGVETERFDTVDPWPTERPTVFFLGRHEERKGLGVLLEAFTVLRASDDGGSPPPQLWVAGDGPETAALRARYPESTDLQWLGVIPEEEKLRRLKGADLLCAPSLGGESFGVVLLEAMAARTVVVASDIDGYRSAAGGHAVLFPPGDVPGLARTLAEQLGTPRGATVAGGADPTTGLDGACEWAAHWSMGSLAEWYESVYRSALVGSAA